MQKIVNAIAIASGAVSLAVVGLGGAGLDIPKFSNPMAAPDAPSRETKPSAPSVGLPPIGF